MSRAADGVETTRHVQNYEICRLPSDLSTQRSVRRQSSSKSQVEKLVAQFHEYIVCFVGATRSNTGSGKKWFTFDDGGIDRERRCHTTRNITTATGSTIHNDSFRQTVVGGWSWPHVESGISVKSTVRHPTTKGTVSSETCGAPGKTVAEFANARLCRTWSETASASLSVLCGEEEDEEQTMERVVIVMHMFVAQAKNGR